jgi:hypothetical protein
VAVIGWSDRRYVKLRIEKDLAMLFSNDFNAGLDIVALFVPRAEDNTIDGACVERRIDFVRFSMPVLSVQSHIAS